MSPICGSARRRLPPWSAPRPISSGPNSCSEIAQLRIGQALIVKHQDRVAVDGIPDRTHTAGIHRLAEIDTVNLGGERWT